MILATTESIAGRRITKTLGLVRGGSVRGRDVGADVTAFMRNLVGGEVPEYTKLFAEAREQALDRLSEEAESLGAHAVVCLRFQTSQIADGAAELLAYGTAVLLADDEG
ncbi:MAG TPA: YbjQ family protein [Thermoanaerobaculia bacterium]|nr:YbjQ family protein [Thermoanaerobaculia bacterium]